MIPCNRYDDCKSELYPDDPMLPVRYPNGQYKSICHDCGYYNPVEVIRDNTRYIELNQKVQANLNYLTNKINDMYDKKKDKGNSAF
jgi:hypothetical protein